MLALDMADCNYDSSGGVTGRQVVPHTGSCKQHIEFFDSVLYWESGPNDWEFYSTEVFPEGFSTVSSYRKSQRVAQAYHIIIQCIKSVSEPQTRKRLDEPPMFAYRAGTLNTIEPSLQGPAFLRHSNGQEDRIIMPVNSPGGLEDPSLGHEITKRSVVPVPGFLSCPAINDQIDDDAALSDNDPYDDCTWF